MDFSKENIVSKSFSKKIVGGLSDFEVRDFLHVLAEEIYRLTQHNRALKNRIQDLENLIKDYRDREHILKESIASAEKWAEKTRKEAEKNSSLVLEKAHNKAENLIQEARHSLQNVYTDIMNLKRLHLQFKTGLKASLQVQMDLLDQDPVFTSNTSSLSGTTSHSFEDKAFLHEKKQEASGEHSGAFKRNKTSGKKEQFNVKSSQGLESSDKALLSLKESLKSLREDFS